MATTIGAPPHATGNGNGNGTGNAHSLPPGPPAPTTTATATGQRSHRIKLQDRDLATLSLPCQDRPYYYDTPPTSPRLASFARDRRDNPAYPTSLTRTRTRTQPTAQVTVTTVSNRGNKLDPAAPFTHPTKLGHHAHVDQGFSPALAHDHANPSACLKRRRLNDLASTRTADGFLVAPNLHLVPRPSAPKEAQQHDLDEQPFPAYLPLPPQSPLDLILLPHIQHTFSPKNPTFHLLSESTTTLIEQEGDLVSALKNVCTGLRGEGFEWRWPGDELRERERRERREQRELAIEQERLEREHVRKSERERILQERHEKAERERIECEQREEVEREREERARQEEEDEAQRRREEEERQRRVKEAEEDEAAKLEQERERGRLDRDDDIKLEPDQNPTEQTEPAPVAPDEARAGEDVQMSDAAPPPLDTSITMPTPSSLPSLPLPNVPAMGETNVSTLHSIAETPATGQTPSSASTPTNLARADDTTRNTPSVSAVDTGSSATSTNDTQPTTKPADQTAQTLDVSAGQSAAEGASEPHRVMEEIETVGPEARDAVDPAIADKDAPEPTTAASDATPSQPQVQSETENVNEHEHGNAHENETEDQEPSTAEEPLIRRSGRQTRATVGLRASQLLYEEAGLGAATPGGSSQRGLSYSPDPYSASRGGAGGAEDVDSSETTPTASNARGRGSAAAAINHGAGVAVASGATTLDDSELDDDAVEEEPFVPEEDIPEYAHRLIDPESYVKRLFVTDGPVELDKAPAGAAAVASGSNAPSGAVETLSSNEQEALVHDCLT